KGFLHKEITNNGTVVSKTYPVIETIIRYIAPILILLIIISNYL
ncbi:hypothetical protein, partial [uncultured Muribaculum sp.]